MRRQCETTTKKRRRVKNTISARGTVNLDILEVGRAALQRLWITKQSSFRYFKASPFIIPLAVMLYVRFPLYLVFNFTHSAYHIFLGPISRKPPARTEFESKLSVVN